MAIEIVSFPIKNMVIFHSYVSLPEAICDNILKLQRCPKMSIFSREDLHEDVQGSWIYPKNIGMVIRHEPRNHRNPEARTNIKGRQMVLNNFWTLQCFFLIIPSRGNSQWKKSLWPEEQLSSRHCWRWFGEGTRGLPVTGQRCSDGVQDYQPIIYGTLWWTNIAMENGHL